MPPAQRQEQLSQTEELRRLKAEITRVTEERDILKNSLRRRPRPMWVETRGYFYTEAARRQ